jgi:hypothetical protein
MTRVRWGTLLIVTSQWVAIGGAIRILGAVEHPAGTSWMPWDALRYGPGAASFLALGTAVALGSWWRTPASPYGPLAMVGLHALAWSAYAALWSAEGSVQHGVVLPAAAAIAEAIGRLRRPAVAEEGEAFADEVTSGAISALYLWAVASKLQAAGAAWIHKTDLPLLIFERALARQDEMGLWLASSAWVQVAGLGVLLVELSGGAYVIAHLRPPLALALCTMHAAIGLSLGYPYLEWCLVIAGVALRTRGREA